MRCLLTAGKHVNDIQAIARQPPETTIKGMLEAVISVGSAPRLYSEDSRPEYITKLCRRQAEVILNHENPNVRATGQGEARHKKHKRIKLGGGQVYDRSSV
jgi:hypothetical protein